MNDNDIIKKENGLYMTEEFKKIIKDYWTYENDKEGEWFLYATLDYYVKVLNDLKDEDIKELNNG